MKYTIYTLLSVALLCLLITGCTDSAIDEAPQAGVPVDTPQTAAPDEAQPSATPVDTPEAGKTPTPGKRRTDEERAAAPVDVDLTVFNTTMLSAEMSNMYANGADFLGMTIRVSGTYDYIFYEEHGIHFHYIITKQGDACCQEGFEFVWNGDHIFPDDYPQMGTPIEVDGVFGILEEDSFRYYYLAVDDIFILG